MMCTWPILKKKSKDFVALFNSNFFDKPDTIAFLFTNIV
jgi:hypothetical protein